MFFFLSNLTDVYLQNKNTQLVEDDVDVSKIVERTEDEISAALKDTKIDESEGKNKLYYKRLARHYLADEVRKDNKGAVLTAAAYHKSTKILVTGKFLYCLCFINLIIYAFLGFSTGAFFIHELPDVNLIHSLSISDQIISTINFNITGDWIAIGCKSLGQLLVWEWQSK